MFYSKGLSCFHVCLQNQVSVATKPPTHTLASTMSIPSCHDIQFELKKEHRWATTKSNASAPPASPEYHYYNQTLSWSDARSFCRVKHSDLATVTSREEAQLLAKTAASRGDAWIGLRLNGPARWLWSDGRGALSSSYWLAGEPNPSDCSPDCCAEMTGGWNEGWNDLNCTLARRLVCQGSESKPFLCDLRFTKFHLQMLNGNSNKTSQ